MENKTKASPTPKVVSSAYRLLDGEEVNLVERIGDGSIITRFNKTPRPVEETDVVCPHFLQLKWATGCPFRCAWCYLQGTLRFLPTKTKPHIKPYPKIEKHLKVFLEQADGHPELLNSGELADSLMYEKNGSPFSKFMISLFQGQNKHRVLLVTKSVYIANLLEIDHNGKAVVSFSLNAPNVARIFEKAPPVDERVEAAAKLSRAGYEVRIRIDPLVPLPGWEQDYRALMELVFSKFRPSRITLGSLRGLRSTINFARDRRWVAFLEEPSNWGLKVAFEIRLRMYQTVLDYLASSYGYHQVGLCKETLAIWDALGMNYRQIKCNCLT